MNKNLDNITKEDKEFLLGINTEGVLRKFLTKQEITKANKLVKNGLLEKGFTVDKHKSVVYYVDSFIFSKLNSYL